MSSAWVFAVYGTAAVLALLLLYLFRARSWYWHMISVLLAIVVGLIPPPDSLRGPQADLIVGGAFVFLFLWGIGAPFFRKPRGAQREQPGHA
jgi:hypothetical protein